MSGTLLPDNWREVVKYRMRKYDLAVMNDIRDDKTMFEACMGCPALRMIYTTIRGVDYVFSSCVFFDKCIKQYPHKIDNKEFT